MVSIVLAMCLLAGLIYIGNLVVSRRTIHRTLDYIVENNGDLKRWDDSSGDYRKVEDKSGFDSILDDLDLEVYPIRTGSIIEIDTVEELKEVEARY